MKHRLLFLSLGAIIAGTALHGATLINMQQLGSPTVYVDNTLPRRDGTGKNFQSTTVVVDDNQTLAFGQSNQTAAAWGTSAIQSRNSAATYTDSSTAGSGTAAQARFNDFASPTLAASNTLVTTTLASTVSISGLPLAGTNQTIGTVNALYFPITTTRTTATNAISIDMTHTPSGSSSAGQGMISAISNITGANDALNIYGINSNVNIANTGALTGNTAMRALSGDIRTSGTAAPVKLAAVYGSVTHSSSATVGTARGLFIDDLTNAGTITNTYGVYIGDMTAGVQSNQAYGVYQVDANARNLFAGEIDVGAGGRLNAVTAAYGVGTVYSLTNTAAAIDFGTTDPAIVIAAAGTYMISAQLNIAYTGATVVAETATIKVRRTNNTPADVSVVPVLDLPVSTTLTHTYGIFQIPPFVYTTALTNDAITIFGNVSAALGAGTIDATAIGTAIIATRLY